MNANAAILAAKGAEDIVEAPCGCAFGVATDTTAFLVAPCALDCRYYLYALDESNRQSKPVEFRFEGGQ